MHDSLAIQIVRNSESWQFFAFVFAAIVGLVISLLDEIQQFKQRPLWVRIGIKIFAFMACFYIFMVNYYVRNGLVDFLGWLKVEHY